jgi:hypothetical protein
VNQGEVFITNLARNFYLVPERARSPVVCSRIGAATPLPHVRFPTRTDADVAPLGVLRCEWVGVRALGCVRVTPPGVLKREWGGWCACIRVCARVSVSVLGARTSWFEQLS